jgi:CRP-like cAMP-binding protein
MLDTLMLETFMASDTVVDNNLQLADPQKNHLLAALPHAIYLRWLPQLEAVDLPLGHVLYEADKVLSHVYFPTTAIVSLLYVMKNGASAEIAVAGNEGLIGIALFMGGSSTPSRALVQNGGAGFRVNAEFVKKEFETSLPVMHLLLGFTQALIAQMTQTAACNKHHTLDQQLCRWLLMTLDRYEGNTLMMTKQLVANMLGVSGDVMREGALRLQEAGLIAYSDGKIMVLDRPALLKHACECYGVVKKEYDRLLPQKQAV